MVNKQNVKQEDASDPRRRRTETAATRRTPIGSLVDLAIGARKQAGCFQICDHICHYICKMLLEGGRCAGGVMTPHRTCARGGDRMAFT
jgi:hypothetical protein